MNAPIHSRAGFGHDATELPLERAAGVPRGRGILSALGAAVGGGLTGIILGVCAGTVGIRIGGGVGASIALLAFYAIHRRRGGRGAWKRAAAGGPGHRRQHSLLRGLVSAIGWLLLMMGGAMALLTYLLSSDELASEMSPVWALASCFALLACSSPFLFLSRAVTPEKMQTHPLGDPRLW